MLLQHKGQLLHHCQRGCGLGVTGQVGADGQTSFSRIQTSREPYCLFRYAPQTTFDLSGVKDNAGCDFTVRVCVTHRSIITSRLCHWRVSRSALPQRCTKCVYVCTTARSRRITANQFMMWEVSCFTAHIFLPIQPSVHREYDYKCHTSYGKIPHWGNEMKASFNCYVRASLWKQDGGTDIILPCKAPKTVPEIRLSLIFHKMNEWERLLAVLGLSTVLHYFIISFTNIQKGSWSVPQIFWEE